MLARSGTSPSVLRLEYDTLVYSCGVQSSTFGVPGADEHCFFLKEIEDARFGQLFAKAEQLSLFANGRSGLVDRMVGFRAIRRACGDALELAMSPATATAEERKRALSFAIIGAGPTGVEFAGGLTWLLRSLIACCARIANEIFIRIDSFSFYLNFTHFL